MKHKILYTALAATVALSSCSLDEENPGGFTMANMATSLDGYQSLLNQVYFGAERFLYGTDGYMELTEGDSDLWTNAGNISSSYTQQFWFFAGAAPNQTYTNGYWNACYDGLGSCNNAITLAGSAPFKTEAERNAKVAEARFMRAVYYFNLVEQFGAVPVCPEVAGTTNYAPARVDPLTIYRDIAIPDLEFAAQWLDKGTDATTTQPTKKAALGMLAKVCLQTREYGTDEFVQKAEDAAKALIADCEAGGATYGAYLYPTYDEVFADANNLNNKEALWKHRWYAGADGHGSSNGNWKCNRNDERFLCHLTKFGARVDDLATRQSWEGSIEGNFMPTQHLLNLYVQQDGTLDPRFHKSFQTEWKANKDFEWTADAQALYRKDAAVVGQKLAIGDKAIKIVMPQDPDYAAEQAAKATASYLVVDYADVYSDAGRNVVMTHDAKENQFKNFYPSLTKHNSTNYFTANAGKKRSGNLAATFIMRMAEVYLIAAETDIVLHGGANAMQYVSKIRTRAGVQPLQGTATIRTILDERGRELCGEYTRFLDLKRTGMFKGASYLQETHPDLAQYFKPEYALRPIPTNYSNLMENKQDFINPGY